MDFREYKELKHYGVLGMHWGQRKSYAELSIKKRKKISEEYKKEMIKSQIDQSRVNNKIRRKAHSQTTNEMFNVAAKNKYSKEFQKKYDKVFAELMSKKYDTMMLDFTEKNKHYKKAQKLVEQYSLEKYDNLARKNTEFIKDVKKYGSMKMATMKKYNGGS